jgi:hypothetical protein
VGVERLKGAFDLRRYGLSRSYPHLQIDTTRSGAVGQAGGVLLTAKAIAAAGLGPAMVSGAVRLA